MEEDATLLGRTTPLVPFAFTRPEGGSSRDDDVSSFEMWQDCGVILTFWEDFVVFDISNLN